jgi:hypothetical protein
MKKTWLIGCLAAGLVGQSVPAQAKCAEMKHYFCVPIYFEKANSSLKKKGSFPKNCSGFANVNNQLVGIVFQDEGPCPNDNTQLVGHITTLCQDTGPWTDAVYWFTARAAFCTMSYENRQNQARVLAGRIHKGMTRTEVRKILKDYEFIGGGLDSEFSEQYYGHPDVVIEVPLEPPGENYSGNNKVNGTVLIKKMELARP